MAGNQKELFARYLEAGDKDRCLDFAITSLQEGSIDIAGLYEEILTPALNEMNTCLSEDSDCIWKEHFKTSIVRTIIECCYPFILKVKKRIKRLGIKVLVFCPENELHEMGARMVTDFFVLNGYDALFVGANTPVLQIKAAINREKPKYAAISVSDYYNLVAAQKAVKLIREAAEHRVYILVGGTAFENNKDAVSLIGADDCIACYADIVRMREGECRYETGI